MGRGLFKGLIEEDGYKGAKKDWIVELSQSWMYWYEMLVNKNGAGEPFDTRQMIIDYIKAVKIQLNNNLEKRFIYFICTRPKVRFDTQREPVFNGDVGDCVLFLKSDAGLHPVSVLFLNPQTQKPYRPKFEIDEKYITVIEEGGSKVTASVHDFLMRVGVNIGMSTNVEYVGVTKNPESRPLGGKHAELTNIIYKSLAESRDVFIGFNLFKVFANAININQNVGYLVANSMTDEIDAKLEGELLEKCLIAYFDSNNQVVNKARERGELKNNLARLGRENKINSVYVDYELELDSEYWQFSSSVRTSARQHCFTVRLEGDAPVINPGRVTASERYEKPHDH